jgi:hypothetical protein
VRQGAHLPKHKPREIILLPALLLPRLPEKSEQQLMKHGVQRRGQCRRHKETYRSRAPVQGAFMDLMGADSVETTKGDYHSVTIGNLVRSIGKRHSVFS